MSCTIFRITIERTPQESIELNTFSTLMTSLISWRHCHAATVNGRCYLATSYNSTQRRPWSRGWCLFGHLSELSSGWRRSPSDAVRSYSIPSNVATAFFLRLRLCRKPSKSDEIVCFNTLCRVCNATFRQLLDQVPTPQSISFIWLLQCSFPGAFGDNNLTARLKSHSDAADFHLSGLHSFTGCFLI